MKIVQYGDWKVAVDIEKTKEYYTNYHKSGSQANRNFAKYCETLNDEEKAFFESFGIDPTCCEIEHFGANRKGEFPCGGYYFVCGNYLEYPKEELLTVEELAESDFEDNNSDTRIYIGLFCFDFQCADYEFNDIPESMPDGFICIQFWCDDMKWLLSEKPEEMMYESPRFWEVNKIIKEKIYNIKQDRINLEEIKNQFVSVFNQLNIKAYPFSRKEIYKYKKKWVKAYSFGRSDVKEIKKLCLTSRKYNPYLWHIFSFEFINCETDEKANQSFNKEPKRECVIVSNVDDIAYRLVNSENLTADILEQFVDVTVTADDFSWTYSKTHEDGMCGPYFYKK